MSNTRRLYTKQDKQRAIKLLQAGNSQREVSRLTGIPAGTISRWGAKDAKPSSSPPVEEPRAERAEAQAWTFEADQPPVIPDTPIAPSTEPATASPGPEPGPAPDAPPEQAAGEAKAKALQAALATMTVEDAKTMVQTVIKAADRRFVKSGCDPIEDEENAMLQTMCAPVVLKWLSGPLTPEVLALTGIVIVFGPRVAEVMKKDRVSRQLPAKTPPPPAAPVVQPHQVVEQAAPSNGFDQQAFLTRLDRGA